MSDTLGIFDGDAVGVGDIKDDVVEAIGLFVGVEVGYGVGDTSDFSIEMQWVSC